MHARYGPIVRINPYEVHISDSSFYDTLYASGGIQRKKNKWAWDTVSMKVPMVDLSVFLLTNSVLRHR